MADIMEEETLLAIINANYARVIHRIPPGSKDNEDKKLLMALEAEVRRTPPDKIDFEGILAKVRVIRDKYKDLPVHPYYE